MSFKEKNREYLALIEPELSRLLGECGAPEGLREAMEYSLSAGGKRLRPCMALAACEMLGGNHAAALPFACALEMIHTYSLIHDDLPCMDDDDFRRGKPSSHKVFGEANAVLAGDGLLSLAFEVMLSSLEREFTRNGLAAARAVSAGAGVNGMVAGQFADLYWEGRQGAGAQELAFIHSHKTAAMIVAALLAGAHSAGADEQAVSAMREFGLAYGLLFQITDDILDVEGSFESLGKSIGKDGREQKLTCPAMLGMEQTREYARSTAERALAALDTFGEKAGYFRELISFTLSRRS